ncbi:MAG: hypothetical protein RL491_334, partial [Bacteroidota bacterium]
HMGDEIVQMVSDRYIELYENIRGAKFVKDQSSDIKSRVEKNVLEALDKIVISH